MKLEEIRKRARDGRLIEPIAHVTGPHPKVQLCFKCALPESHPSHKIPPEHAFPITVSEAKRIQRRGGIAVDWQGEHPDSDSARPMLPGHDFVPSLHVDLCMCGSNPSIAGFDLDSRTTQPISYVFARGQVRPGDKDVPLCMPCVRTLEGLGFTTNPF